MFNTPILFLIFNRPMITASVFEAIRRQQPRRLYIAADGPRKDRLGESELCEQTRNLVLNNIDWNCEVKTLFRDSNMGCGKSVSSAIDWFFEYEEMGIIIEDDCLPNGSFFQFCSELLSLYKDVEHIKCISGNNFQDGIKRGDADYYFSRYAHIWGWATWKRVWKDYDFEILDWNDRKKRKPLFKIFSKKDMIFYWLKKFQNVYNKKVDTWDYQFTYLIWKNEGVSILPNQNLVSNIGFGKTATHTLSIESKLSKIRTITLSFPLSHPAEISINEAADLYTFKQYFRRNFIFSLKDKISYFLNNYFE